MDREVKKHSTDTDSQSIECYSLFLDSDVISPLEAICSFVSICLAKLKKYGIKLFKLCDPDD